MYLRRAVVITAAVIAGLAGSVLPATAAPQPAAIACSAAHSHKLQWRGGPINHYAWVQLIYWGSWWKKHGKAAKAELKGLYTGLGASSWTATLTQYCDQDGKPEWPSRLLGGTLSVAANPDRKPTDKQFGAMIAEYAPPSDGGVPPVDVIVTPPGTVPAFDSAKGDCSHHAWSAIHIKDGSTIDQPWADLAYGVIAKAGCGWGLSRTKKTAVADALSVAAGHEWAEAVTDPFPYTKHMANPGTGWAAANGPEVADLCAPYGHRLVANDPHVFRLKLKTGQFVMQKLWSNRAAGCVADTGS